MKIKILGILLILIFVFLFLYFSFTFSFGNPESQLFTEPYLKFLSEAEFLKPLNLKNSLNFYSDQFKGELKLDRLSQNQTYILPNKSGQILILSQAFPSMLIKFTSNGISGASIQDLAKETSIFIDNEGNVGIGTENPSAKLQVAGRIQASEDICTDSAGGKCLSELEKLEELKSSLGKLKSSTESALKTESALEGKGSLNYIPIWETDSKIGNSIIYQSGNNIGIDMVPSYKLDVPGTIRVLGFRMPVSPKKGYGLISNEEGVGTWEPVLTPHLSKGDLAEKFLIEDNCQKENNCPESGDLVSINKERKIEKAIGAFNKRLIGIISENPAITFNGDLDDKKSRPVALSGRIKAKVSLKGGEIEIGDWITSSEIPGIGQKATKRGRVVGIALESLSEKDFQDCQNKKVLDCSAKIGKIEILINLTDI